MLILATKLKNAINRAAPADWNYALEYKLKNIVVNGNKFGCSGVIRNPKNDAIVYVSTEEPCLSSLHYMYHYADSFNDYLGYHNRWADTLEELVDGIIQCLCTPVREAKDFRV